MKHKRNLDYKFKQEKYYGWFPGIYKDGKTFTVTPVQFLNGRFRCEYDYKTKWRFTRLSVNPLYYIFRKDERYYIDVDRQGGYGLIGFVIKQDRYFVTLKMNTSDARLKKFPRIKIVNISIGEDVPFIDYNLLF